jgi:hypothetical protein
MKTIAMMTMGLLVSTSLSAQSYENEPIIIVDPEDPIADLLEPITPEPPKEGQTAQDKLDELIERIRREHSTFSERHQRIAERIEKDEQVYLGMLSDFAAMAFNASDPEADPTLAPKTDELTRLLFRAPNDRDFYERLYLINAVWLQNQDQIEKFSYLDKKLSAMATEIQNRQRRFKQILIGFGTVVGMGVGGYLGTRAAAKIPVQATDGALSLLTKRGTQVFIIVSGAAVGGSAGGFVGFLGADWLTNYERQYLKPIDGSADTREILDYLEH